MERLKQAVRRLESEWDRKAQIAELQATGDLLLTGYALELPGMPRILPLWVEAYYYCPGKFPDMSCHRTPLQSGRFGKLYFHSKGYGGVDVCLSLGDYCLSWLIKCSLVGDEFCSQTALRRRLEPVRGYEGDALSPLPQPRRGNIWHSPRVGLGPGEYQLELLASLLELGQYPYRFARGYGMRKLRELANK